MNNFSIEAFVKGCKAVIKGGQTREQANRELFNRYCAYLCSHQQHQPSTTTLDNNFRP